MELHGTTGPKENLVTLFMREALRYCAPRPSPFAMNRLRKEGADLVYHCAKQHSEPTGDKRAGNVDELVLSAIPGLRRLKCLSLSVYPSSLIHPGLLLQNNKVSG